MLVVIPGDVGLFEVPQAGDDEDDENDEDPSVNGVVETRPLGVLCRFFGHSFRDCEISLVQLAEDGVDPSDQGIRLLAEAHRVRSAIPFKKGINFPYMFCLGVRGWTSWRLVR